METLNLIGGAWLAGRYCFNLVTPLAVQSRSVWATEANAEPQPLRAPSEPDSRG